MYTMAVAWLPLRDVPLAWLCNEPRCGRNQRGIRLCGEEKMMGGVALHHSGKGTEWFLTFTYCKQGKPVVWLLLRLHPCCVAWGLYFQRLSE